MNVNRLLAVLLAGLLQLLPMLRAVIPLEARGLTPSSWAWVLKLGGAAAALMGGYDAASGATQIVAPYTVNATLGVAYSRQLTTSGQTAHSWSASTAAKGTAVFPLTPGLWLTNSNGKIAGVPTWAGTSNITISAWENTGNGGASVSAVFVFTITNTGPPPPTAPIITTQPQSQTHYVNDTAGFSVAASGTTPLGYQWRFQGGPIANATTTAYTIGTVQTSDAGSYSVVVTNAGGAVTSAVAVLTVLQPSADLTTSSTGPANVAPGATVGCVVSVTNLGPSTASNVVVSDALPPGVAFISATGGGVANGSTVTWPAIASLSPGSGTSFTVSLTAPNNGSFTNIASATASTADPNAANNNGTAASSRLITTVTPQADVAVFSSGPTTVNAGTAFAYTVTVTNLGPSTASSVAVTDTLPSAVTFVSASGGGVAAAGTVAWPAIANLASGAAASFTVTVVAPGSGTLTNRASATSPTFDPVAGNNDGGGAAAVVVTTVQPQADLAVLASGPAAVLSGSNLTYSITVTNLGPSAASGVVVSDVLPAGASFVGATGGAALNGNVVTWPSIASLNSGAAASFTVTVTAPVAGSLTNSASCASSTPDPVPANNDGTGPASIVVTAIGQEADLAVLMTGASTVLPGSNLTYTITITNFGPSAATNVVLSDTLPPAVTFVSATGAGAVNSGVVNWPAIASLPSGGGASFNVIVTAPLSGSFTNIASATSSTSDPNASNNNGTGQASRLVTTAAPQADLAVTSGGPATVNAGSAFSYTITVTNVGPSAATSVAVTDALPVGASFVSATGGGVASAGTVTWPTIASLTSGAGVVFSVTVTAPGSGTLTNRASATSPTPDPVAANNDGSGAAAIVTTTVQPQADVIVTCTGPGSVSAGVTFSYSIAVTNLGPSSAANVIVSDRLPTNLVFVSATGGGLFASNVVTWPALPSLASGGGTTFSLTVTAATVGAFTNVVVASSSTPDPAPANNSGALPPSQVATTITPAVAVFGITPGTHSLNPQTGLFEEVVTVSNAGVTTIAAFRLYVTGLRSGVQLYNATGTNTGRPFVQYNAPINPNQATALRLEFFVLDRLPFTETLQAEAVLPVAATTNSGNGLQISRLITDSRIAGATRFGIEFPTTPGQVYTIIYTDDGMKTWLVATPSITASSTVTQWYDDGPPKTVSPPPSGNGRYYRVIAGAATP